MGKVPTDSLTQDTLFSTPYLHDQVLQTVEVIGRNERSYKNTNSFIGTKTETPLKDIPQSIGYVTKELVRDQGATTVNEVVKNISGVNQYTFYNDFSIRGFRTTGNRNSGTLSMVCEHRQVFGNSSHWQISSVLKSSKVLLLLSSAMLHRVVLLIV